MNITSIHFQLKSTTKATQQTTGTWVSRTFQLCILILAVSVAGRNRVLAQVHPCDQECRVEMPEGCNGSPELFADGESSIKATVYLKECISNLKEITWSFEGESHGCTITPVIDEANPDRPPMQAIITSGTKNGTVTVKAHAKFDQNCGSGTQLDLTCDPTKGVELVGADDDDDDDDDGHASSGSGGGYSSIVAAGTSTGCSSCSSGGSSGSHGGSSTQSTLGSGGFGNKNGPVFNMGQGNNNYRQNSGVVGFQATAPTLVGPSMLSLPYIRPGVQKISPGGVVNQFKNPQGLVKIVPAAGNLHKFDMQVFSQNQVTGTDANGNYTTAGNPFTTWTIENVSEDAKQIRISENRGGSLVKQYTYVFENATGKWSMSDSGNLRTSVSWRQTDAQGLIHEYREIKSGAVLVKKRQRTYKIIGGKEKLVQTDIGDGSAMKSTVYNRYLTGSSEGKIKRTDYPGLNPV